ncbi:selenide, water dikinase SelD [Alsobacter sp. SYSU M60028]|uniref:Selenide, water dikinase SelD n=1 Tax=Alsobacter ponti TaxID=2962936 RepID=A0ABT1L858_9HYPH|nr:selenide, water dikinase SelD [Alsobacter ponti]MCP8937569.1 selenide, water dikinase SelD [Alsobacter ponti]
MNAAPAGFVRHDVVLVGGGHTHVQVMTAFAMRQEPGVRLTLVTDRLLTPYSGMLPGHVAGIYDADEMHIDLHRLARATGTRLVFAPAVGLDRASREVLFADRPPLRYDTLSLDVGITPDLSGIAGAREFGIAVKPISAFLGKLDKLLVSASRPDGPRRIVVVGGGAAGVEIACALRRRLSGPTAAAGGSCGPVEIAVVTGVDLVPTLNDRARRHVRAALARLGVEAHTGFRVAQVRDDAVVAEDGRVLPADAVLFSTAARAPAWLAASGLPTAEDGSVTTRRTLQVTDDDAVFAVGDCGVVVDDRREKAGVFAVRQGPVLAANIRARLRKQKLAEHRAQRRFLTLLATGDGRAVAARGSWFAAEGAWVWRWKDRIDRRFMRMFSGFGSAMARPATDAELEAGTAMRCAGCAAKVAPDPLRRALHRLPPAPPPKDDVLVSLDPPDDAAVVRVTDGLAQVETVDQITSPVSDPYLFGRIAALHALNDILAMGGEPRRALAIATVGHGRAEAVEGDLLQLLAGARRELDAHGVSLIGGHSGEGDRLALGFAVTGRVSPNAIRRKSDLRVGDVLVLTKPIGVGLAMAADMRGAASAAVAERAIAAMLASNAPAAAVLSSRARAMTDVTGFGLAGHLLEMLRPSGLRACLRLEAVPVLEGAVELARRGFQSSLTPGNAALARDVTFKNPGDAALLFDPQTSGGLLAAVAPDRADEALSALAASGCMAASIGEVLPPGAATPIVCEGSMLG